MLVTDRHRQIAKWLRENVHAAHYYDVWHVAKGTNSLLMLIKYVYVFVES